MGHPTVPHLLSRDERLEGAAGVVDGEQGVRVVIADGHGREDGGVASNAVADAKLTYQRMVVDILTTAAEDDEAVARGHGLEAEGGIEREEVLG